MLTFARFVSLVRQYQQMEAHFRKDYGRLVAHVLTMYLNSQGVTDTAEHEKTLNDALRLVDRDYLGAVSPIVFEGGSWRVKPPNEGQATPV